MVATRCSDKEAVSTCLSRAAEPAYSEEFELALDMSKGNHGISAITGFTECITTRVVALYYTMFVES